jgi:hypothetical protein
MDVKYRAFIQWRDYNKYYDNVMNRVKLRLIYEHKKRLMWSFMRMKEISDKVIHMEFMEETEQGLNANQDL